MASTGQEWYEHFRRHSSGTYSNQYMIVDFKRFKPKQPLKPGLLWVVEDMPGLVVGGDKSDTLSRGYWPSYNVPYWSDIARKSGWSKVAEKHGNYFTYELNPRAKIFRRDQGAVKDIDSLKDFARYNDYTKDAYSADLNGWPNPNNAICSRGDLDSSHPTPGGCYDSK